MRRLAAAGGITLALLTPATASEPQIWEIDEAQHFMEGDLSGVSVDSEGRLRLAPSAPVLHNPAVPYVWSLARDARGRIYAGTGNEGKVFRIDGGEATLLFDSAELEVHALAIGKDGTVYAGTSPDGAVYAIGEKGDATQLFNPEERYIWAIAFDTQGRLLVATGDPGRLHRVAVDGQAEVLLDGPETHLTALAAGSAGSVYAGSSPSGVIYRIGPDGKVTVVHDTPYREIKALAVAPDGTVFAAAIDGRDKEDLSRPTPTPPSPAATTSAEEVTVTETFVGVVPFAAPTPAVGPRTLESPRTGQSKGALLKLLPGGELETLWSSTDETPYALARQGDHLLMGTGDKGRLYRIAGDRTWEMLLSLPSLQLTGIVATPDGGAVIATSNPGAIYGLGAVPGKEGTFVSKVRDTETLSSWGRVHWDARTPNGTDLDVLTRGGDTAAPDTTWSDWRPPRQGQKDTALAGERTRFLQIKAVLRGKGGATPVVERIRAVYLQRNLRPEVTSVTVHAPGEVFQKPLSITGETEILGLDPTPTPPPDRSAAGAASVLAATTFGRKLYERGLQTFSWKAEDGNGDPLTYDVELRLVGERPYRSLRKGLTDSVLAWDTSTVPSGRYVVRIVARDTPSNPEDQALAGDKEGAPFSVDTTPPTVTASIVGPGRIRATARDDFSLIRKAEYAVDGGTWELIHPADGISDSEEETYELTLRDLAGGPHIVVIRATDLLGNMSTARVLLE